METIQLKDIQKTFHLGGEIVRALDGIALTVSRGDFLAVIGTSGSGKSTLMNIMGCLDQADHGEYWLEGVPVNQIEAVILSLSGGIIGILTGIGIAFGLGNAMGTQVIFEPFMILLSVGFTAVVGVFFGYYPAKKASALNPIDAMRYD